MNEHHPANQTDSTLSVVSLSLGIASILLVGVGGILGIAAIIVGVMSLHRQQSKTRSIVGIITGSIGVLLALAVLAVYMALPLLQQNNRDTARKSEVAQIASDVVEFRSLNQGEWPTKYQLPKENYVYISDIKQTAYDGIGYDGNPQTSTEHAVYTIGKDCSDNTSSSSFAIRILLENDTIYCSGS